MPGLGHRQAMAERGAAQVGVQEGDHAADAAHPEPGRQVVGPVGRHQRHNLALAQPLRQGPATIAAGLARQLVVGQGFGVRQQGRRVGLAIGPFVYDAGQQPMGLLAQARGHLQRPHPGPVGVAGAPPRGFGLILCGLGGTHGGSRESDRNRRRCMGAAYGLGCNRCPRTLRNKTGSRGPVRRGPGHAP